MSDTQGPIRPSISCINASWQIVLTANSFLTHDNDNSLIISTFPTCQPQLEPQHCSLQDHFGSLSTHTRDLQSSLMVPQLPPTPTKPGKSLEHRVPPNTTTIRPFGCQHILNNVNTQRSTDNGAPEQPYGRRKRKRHQKWRQQNDSASLSEPRDPDFESSKATSSGTHSLVRSRHG